MLNQYNFTALETLLASLTNRALRLDYNDQKAGYNNVADDLKYSAEQHQGAIWVKEGEREEAVRTNEMWELHLDNKEETDYKKYMAATSKSLIERFTSDPAVIQAMEALYPLFNGLLKGKFTSAHLKYNDQLCNYTSLQEAIDLHDDCIEREDWISDEEYQKALTTNTMWEFQWYPDTPIGFYKIQASSLQAIVDYFKDSEGESK